MFEDDVFGPIPDIIDLGDLKQKPLSPRLDPNAHPVTPYSTAASAPATEWWVAMFILTPSQNGFFLTSNFSIQKSENQQFLFRNGRKYDNLGYFDLFRIKC